MRIRRIRDLSLIETKPRLVLATDSIGSIGSKEHDALRVDPSITGFFLARVPLVELLCLGATPASYVLTSSNEMAPTGQAVLAGVRRAFRPFRLAKDHENGSSEENMPSSMTAAGITVLATLSDDWTEAKAQAGDWLYLAGWPSVGQAVLDQPVRLISLSDVAALRRDERVGVMVPLGSRGISHELKQLGFELIASAPELPLELSGGPASAIIFSAEEQAADWPVMAEVTLLGQLIEPAED
ncbi:MAG TPA: hypothetical protein GXZ74_05655 [Tissierellia bacterium]|nr:hypothetical protein [Tissierellia bacterium]